MQSNILTKRQRQVLRFIYSSIKNSGYPPTLADLREELDVSSNQAVLDFLNILENKKLIKREEGAARGLKILKKGFETLGVKSMFPSLGVIAAGPYKYSIDDLEWKEFGDAKISEDVFLAKISGDSMIGIGLVDGDHVMVQKSQEFRNGDVVLARDNNDMTIKTLVSDNGRSYLKPENPHYKNIPIYPETRLIGKVIGKIGGKIK